MLQLENYQQHEHHIPSTGKFIIAQFDAESIVVYQAFKDSIAKYAVEHQKFGGFDYDFNRMTWLKPSFLWMMYYSGWAKKQNQENVLAIKMKREGFDRVLEEAVMSSFQANIYSTRKEWEEKLKNSDVQIQWEHYYDLFGAKTDRYAAKIGIKGALQSMYNDEWIIEIQNVTPYVNTQQGLLETNEIAMLQLPHERAYTPADLTILRKIEATTISL
ncbi:MAG TPA: DUF4291 domain-containing protein [Flavipsychrobacter sp.]|jgi:hypothetical protein|nr:DUF4291 domain-containing protein [Flavipsychrobacter sp.]